MVATSKLSILLSFVAFAAAVPHTARQAPAVTLCKPDLQGAPVSILGLNSNNSFIEWSSNNTNKAPLQLAAPGVRKSIQTGEFLVEPTKGSGSTYTIKSRANKALAVTISGGKVDLEHFTKGQANQVFNIDCGQCTQDGFSFGCGISDPATGQCIVPDAKGQLVLGSCNVVDGLHMIPELVSKATCH